MPPHQVQDATDGASIEKIVATPPAHRERVCTASAKEFAMHEVISIADQYREIWNETEPVCRRAQLTQRWAAPATSCDPLAAVAGRDTIDPLMASVQRHLPGHRFARRGSVDAHGHHRRFSWRLTSPDGIVVAKGTDFAVLNAEEQWRTVPGFLDMPGSNA
jgi:hypothetical protein